MSADLPKDDWNTYRTRFLVRAKKLTEPLTFTDPLGREHCGCPGDYLVQSSEGLLRIAPREIFEDVYVPLAQPSAVIPNRAPKEGAPETYVRMGSGVPPTSRSSLSESVFRTPEA